jgi:hypothetical protein
MLNWPTGSAAELGATLLLSGPLVPALLVASWLDRSLGGDDRLADPPGRPCT